MFMSEILKNNWKIVKRNFFFFFIIILLYFLISMGGAFALNWFIPIKIISNALVTLLVCWVNIGIFIVSLKKVKGESTKITDFFIGYNYLPSYIGAYILYLVICFCGLILLLFPAFIWYLKFGFWPYLIIDKKLNAIESLRASAKLTRGYKWDIFGFYIVTLIIEIIGILLLVIGLFWTTPLIWLSWASLYIKLIEEQGNKIKL